MKISEFNNLTIKEAATWYYDFGVNTIPINPITKIPLIKWTEWQDRRLPRDYFQGLCNDGYFDEDKGIGLIAGKLYDKNEGNYLVGIDADNFPAIEAIRTVKDKKIALEDFTKEGIIVEGYSNGRTHFLLISHKPYKPLSSTASDDPNCPAIEIKSNGKFLIIVPPSLSKDGIKRQIIAYPNQDLEFNFCDNLDKRIDQILNEYGISYLSDSGNGDSNDKPIRDLFKKGTVIHEGHNRHKALLRIMESLLKRNYGILDIDKIKLLAEEWNQEHCIPPLNETEFEKQWKCATKWTGEKSNENPNVDVDNNNENNTQEKEIYPELENNIFYQINEKPPKYVIAYKQKNKVIEVTVKTDTKQIGNNKSIAKYLIHNTTYLACIPIKIIRHTSPLAFLQTVDKYTMTFVDGVGQKKTFAHKTLSEIVQCLKDSGYVLGDGADKALNALLWGYAERNIIEDNVEMNYVGFFTDKENNIIASNIDILEPNWDKISDALNFIIELKPYYENRLDLLATSIVWGMIAPVMFMLKQNNHFLKLLHFYGSANATKSNTGKVILALDGHQEDRKYSLNLSRFDSIARVGEALGHTTFPILVDEMDLMNPKHHWLIEVLKSIVESQISRSKFPSSRASGTIDIPALCLPILTGNPPPPLNESAYMKRVIARYFPQSETMKESDPQSSKFREFVRINLARLKALGDFRNWYIMNNQKEILDETSPPPLELGLKILKTAFEYSGIEIPDWLEKERLAEDQLEESLEDNDVIVKRAFEKYIDEQFNKAIHFWKSQLVKDETIQIPNDISDRLVKLAESNVLPDIKYSNRNFAIIIRKGILDELYNHGVTGKQLPNLRSLAAYMKGDYKKSDGKNVVSITRHQLTEYFDKEVEETGSAGSAGSAGSLGNTYGINPEEASTSQGGRGKMTQYLYSCYSNNCNFVTNDRKEYETHGIIEHRGKPCYPNIADLKLYGWNAQGKKWEKPVDRSEDIQNYVDKLMEENM